MGTVINIVAFVQRCVFLRYMVDVILRVCIYVGGIKPLVSAWKVLAPPLWGRD